MNSFLIKQIQCPKCKQLGKDTSHDNFAIYSDGHSFCFSCGWSSRGNELVRFKSKTILKEQSMENKETAVFLPPDCTTEYPKRALAWCFQYEITVNDLLLNNGLWSPSIGRLIFPIYGPDPSIYGDNSNLLAWQGRDFSEEKGKPKWFGRGNLRDTLNILGRGSCSSDKDRLIITEDIISSIRCSKFCFSMPLYGSFIGKERFKRLKLLGYNNIYIFLDPDKRVESIKEARLGQLYGLNVHPIFADCDPKELNDLELKRILDFSFKV